MIYLNRNKTTKELKPTNGFKSQEYRIYELNKKIKPFRLSRSKFSDFFWLKINDFTKSLECEIRIPQLLVNGEVKWFKPRVKVI